ncbi:MAG: hypothetical protein FJZ58_04125 [Chlamydiae bacterium]|nr:hypothetical protein [Chlamydiota bacterium]
MASETIGKITQGPLAEKIADFVKEHAFFDHSNSTWAFPSLFPLLRVVALGSKVLLLAQTRDPLVGSLLSIKCVAIVCEIAGTFFSHSGCCTASLVLDAISHLLNIVICLDSGMADHVLREILLLFADIRTLAALTYGSVPLLAMALSTTACAAILRLISAGDLFTGYLGLCELLPHAFALNALGEISFSDSAAELLRTYWSLSPSCF